MHFESSQLEEHNSKKNLDMVTCKICYGLDQKSVVCVNCEQVYCEHCIYEWTSKRSLTCPYCRHDWASQKPSRMWKNLADQINAACNYCQ